MFTEKPLKLSILETNFIHFQIMKVKARDLLDLSLSLYNALTDSEVIFPYIL